MVNFNHSKLSFYLATSSDSWSIGDSAPTYRHPFHLTATVRVPATQFPTKFERNHQHFLVSSDKRTTGNKHDDVRDSEDAVWDVSIVYTVLGYTWALVLCLCVCVVRRQECMTNASDVSTTESAHVWLLSNGLIRLHHPHCTINQPINLRTIRLVRCLLQQLEYSTKLTL